MNGGVALQPHQRPGPGRGGLSKVASPAWAVGEPRVSGLLVADDDGPGPAGLGSGVWLSRPSDENMPAPGDDAELLDTVSGLESVDDGDGGGLGLVALPDLEGAPAPVDQQADDDLGVDSLLLASHPPS